LQAKIPVVLAGDFNVAPTPIDIYQTKSWNDDALVQPESRAAYANLVKQGWVDALRELHPDERIYTFWHYWRKSWQRNAGLRLDHLLVSPQLAPFLKSAGVDLTVRAETEASDHAPAWIELRPRQQSRKKTSLSKGKAPRS
jgi:exodeoxyribonuclease-3